MYLLCFIDADTIPLMSTPKLFAQCLIVSMNGTNGTVVCCTRNSGGRFLL